MTGAIRPVQQSPAAVFTGMAQAIARLEGRLVEPQETLSKPPGEDLKSPTDSTHPSMADKPAGIIAEPEGRSVEPQEALSKPPGEDLKSPTDSTYPSIADDPAGIAEPPPGPIECTFVDDAPPWDARTAESQKAFSDSDIEAFIEAFNNPDSTHPAAGKSEPIESSARASSESASVVPHNWPRRNRDTPNKLLPQNVEILEPSRVAPASARALAPVAVPGRVAFAKFLASMDPSLAEHSQDEILRQVRRISFSIEFTNGRYASFQSGLIGKASRSSRIRRRLGFAAALALLIVGAILAMRAQGVDAVSSIWPDFLQQLRSGPAAQLASKVPRAVQRAVAPVDRSREGNGNLNPPTAEQETAPPADTAVLRREQANVEEVGDGRNTAPVASSVGSSPDRSRGEEPADKDQAGAAMQDLPVRSDAAPGRAYVDRAQDLMKKGDVEAAIISLNQAISLNPKDAAAYRTRGLAYVYKSDNDNAMSDFTRAIQFAKVAPGQLSSIDIFSIYRSRALLYDVKGLHSREIADLTEMIDMYWKDPGLTEALDRMWTAARAKTLIASIHRLRAAAYARISANDKAFTDLALAIELDPQHAAEAYNDRAMLEDKLGNRTQAVTDFRKAMALDPNMKEPRESLARMGLGR